MPPLVLKLRPSGREFFNELNLVVPWAELVELIEPHAPSGKTGRPPFAVLTTLRIHFMQQWFGLFDSAMQEALHDVPLYCEFARLDADITRLPDESTIVHFRGLLKRLRTNANMLRKSMKTQLKFHCANS